MLVDVVAESAGVDSIVRVVGFLVTKRRASCTVDHQESLLSCITSFAVVFVLDPSTSAPITDRRDFQHEQSFVPAASRASLEGPGAGSARLWITGRASAVLHHTESRLSVQPVKPNAGAPDLPLASPAINLLTPHLTMSSTSSSSAAGDNVARPAHAPAPAIELRDPEDLSTQRIEEAFAALRSYFPAATCQGKSLEYSVAELTALPKEMLVQRCLTLQVELMALRHLTDTKLARMEQCLGSMEAVFAGFM
ncbi:hypothetical protein AURDEDRAFT_128097 [Auricularia subglabra TFB-10046 SS5]|uniref:Uncharacterized protein n=1 Tax=Auricularia subglabra (strain TFB-10046 / SS5) TaxID=717982 RepID=J0WW90_AURST|nr:hypothetical protein AURDEDRAFT_128097 [Auricularia subglabra TFB-10046 SS5]